MDPTEKGVWWKDDGQWVRYPPEMAAKIERAKRNGDTNVMVGPLISSRYPSGTNYAIDLLTMKQKNLTTGFSRDVKIIPASSAQEHEESEEDVDDPVSPILRRMGKVINNKEEAGKDVVRMVPSITVDLQKLNPHCIVDGQCNLVLKLPKTVAHSERLNSLTRKTLALLLEKLTARDFIKSVIASKSQGFSQCNHVWKVRQCNSYTVGRAENPEIYSSFLNHLCALAEEDDGLVDALFRVAEKGNTGAGDRVEFVFKGSSVDEGRSVFEPAESGVVTGYTRLLPLPSEGGRKVSVYLTMCEFVQGTRYLNVVKGASLFIAQLVPTLTEM
ncbi:hypothetical protein SUGI_0287730 [Cryptomeria japonica]|nr:hypothetical protein SUGI_0287730 [Cryptomeria japonica]